MFCGALFLCAAKLAKVLQRNCKNCTVYIETAGRVWYALGVERLHKTERSIGYEMTVFSRCLEFPAARRLERRS